MKPLIEIKGLSKKFRISHQGQTHLNLREAITDVFRKRDDNAEDFWALRDVSFNVERGEAVGIIGRNGAGKSTLLKILSKITPPTEGSIISRGRIASLLEVGTGFHTELTGRENIFFNGSLLGLKKKEIESKFDAIVDFAGTERFLDTPLKQYSSGMQLRLAFAVAAFLEPEVLVIDEVLAVGDAEFQKKCLRKMEDVGTSGRTILFVSHNLSAVTRLCPRSVLLRDGKLEAIGPSEEIVGIYADTLAQGNYLKDGMIDLADRNGVVQKIEVVCDGNSSTTTFMGGKVEVRVYFKVDQPLTTPVLGVIIKDKHNIPLVGVNNRHYIGNFPTPPVAEGCISMTVPYLSLFEGIYHVDIHFGNEFRDLEVLRECFQITVEPLSFSKSGAMPDRNINKLFFRDVEWELKTK